MILYEFDNEHNQTKALKLQYYTFNQICRDALIYIFVIALPF